MGLDPRISPSNASGPVWDWFPSRTSFLVLPRIALQEMPEEWQARFVALLREAEAMGIVTPDLDVCRRDDKGRLQKVPKAWCNYRRGTLRDAMAQEEACAES